MLNKHTSGLGFWRNMRVPLVIGLAALLVACGGGGGGTNASEVPNVLTITAVAAPAAPTLALVSKTGISINLSFTTVTGASNYMLTRTGASSANFQPTDGVFLDSALQPNSTYSYTIQACNNATPMVCSENSAMLAVTTSSTTPDTGITASQCYEAGSDVLVSCTRAGATALNNQQDGMVGRDVTDNNAADGKLGFSYTKISDTGTDLPASATSWDCVRDNITGLMWENKASSGLRAGSTGYTNYDNLANYSQAQIDASTNSVGFKKAVNAAGLCGKSDWRLPTGNELQGIVDYGVASPSIDSNYFANTQSNGYWSASPYVGSAYYAWVVNFNGGSVDYGSRYGSYHVRLVR